MKRILLMAFAGCLISLSSCVRQGATGPQGPQGPQGNANVVGEDAFTVTPSMWQWDAGLNGWIVTYSDPNITSDIANRGSVEIFLYHSYENAWRNLPDIVNGTQFTYVFSQGGFELHYDNVNGTTPQLPPDAFTFRVVVVAPAFKQAHPNTNWKNYNEAMAALNNTSTAPAANQ